MRNSKYKELGTEPVESYLRSEVGVIVKPGDVKNIGIVIREMLGEQEAWKDRLVELRSEYVFNFGKSSEVGANYIRKLLGERL